jgi:hypothetical protein
MAKFIHLYDRRTDPALAQSGPKIGFNHDRSVPE